MTDSILISIKPEFVDRIMTGMKKYEYRKYPVSRKFRVEYMVIYSTFPIQKVVGIAEVLDICENAPEAVWVRTRQESGVTEEEFRAYFGNSFKAFAIHIGRVWPICPPLKLSQLDPEMRPPQTFMAMPEEIMQTLKLQCGIVSQI